MSHFTSLPSWNCPAEEYFKSWIRSSCGGSAVYKPEYPWGYVFNPWPHSVCQGSGIVMGYGVGHRHSSDPSFLWLWCRSITAALIWPPAQELPYAADVALKRKKKLNNVAILSFMNMNYSREFLSRKGPWRTMQFVYFLYLILQMKKLCAREYWHRVINFDSSRLPLYQPCLWHV